MAFITWLSTILPSLKLIPTNLFMVFCNNLDFFMINSLFLFQKYIFDLFYSKLFQSFFPFPLQQRFLNYPSILASSFPFQLLIAPAPFELSVRLPAVPLPSLLLSLTQFLF